MKQTTTKAITLGLFASLFLTLASCSKKEKTTPGESDEALPNELLVSIHEADGTGFDSLYYNSNNKLVSIASYESMMSSLAYYGEQYSIGTSGQTSHATTIYDGTTVDRKDSLVYGEKTVLIYGLLATGTAEWDKDTTTLTLNADGQVQQAKIQAGSYSSLSTYEYEGKNLVRYTRETNSSGQTTKLVLAASYDDKFNPVYGIGRYNLRFGPVYSSSLFWPYGSAKGMEDFNTFDSYNNPEKVEVVETRDGSTILDVTLMYSYQYDESTGLPLQQTIVVSGTTTGGQVSFNKEFLFLYQQR
jgi:hypothetical protein